MTTYIIAWAIMALITIYALQHEVTIMRKLIGIRSSWTIESVLIMTVLGAMVPAGILYLWALTRRNGQLRVEARRPEQVV